MSEVRKLNESPSTALNVNADSLVAFSGDSLVKIPAGHFFQIQGNAENVDNVRKGIYNVTSGTKGLPVTCYGGSLLISLTSDGTIFQMLFPSTGGLFVRHYNSVWSDWRQVSLV